MKRLPVILIPFIFTLATYAQNPLTLIDYWQGENLGDYFGLGMATGDFDDDSYMEFILGAFGWNNNTGRNYIYPGGPQFPTEYTWTIQGQLEGEQYGAATQNVGDISGDGIDDFAIGEPSYGAAIDSSRLDIYFGSIPIDTIPDWTFYSPFHNTPHIWSVDSCGDVNGDGGNDMIVYVSGVFYDPETVYIFWGGNLLDTIPDWTYTIDINPQPYPSGIGDVNGDGFSDIMIKEYDHRALIFFGGSQMDTIPDVIFDDGHIFNNVGRGVGDVNADGYADVALTWSFPDSTRDVVHYGGPDMDTEPDMWLKEWNGEYSVSLGHEISCGDCNGDGYSDILTMTGYGPNLAAVQVHLGGPDFNPIPDAYVTGNAMWGYGKYLDAGDFNGDGRYELLVAAVEDAFHRGTVYLYEGPDVWIDYGSPVEPGDLRHAPGWYRLEQNYPNPFNATTNIHFELGKLSMVSLAVYDIKGRKVKELIDRKELLPNEYNVSWNSRNQSGQPVASGMYLLVLQVDSGEDRQFREMKKMVLVR